MLVSKDHVGKRFGRLNETSCIVNALVNPLSRTFLKELERILSREFRTTSTEVLDLGASLRAPCTMDDHAVQRFQ